jgi:hypothetical protein
VKTLYSMVGCIAIAGIVGTVGALAKIPHLHAGVISACCAILWVTLIQVICDKE